MNHVAAQEAMDGMRKAMAAKGEDDITWIVNQLCQEFYLPHLMAIEVLEAFVEMENSGVTLEYAKEIGDVFVFLAFICQRFAVQTNAFDMQYHANGQGKSSGIYEVLHEKALGIADGDVQENVDDFVTHLFSLLMHLPRPINIVKVMDKVIQKNQANRPKEYYLCTDSSGKKLREDEILAKYQHTEIMLRMLRNHYHATLEPWMHQPFAELILDFRHSELNQNKLQAELPKYDMFLAEQARVWIVEGLSIEYSSLSTYTKHKLMYALQKLGAEKIH